MNILYGIQTTGNGHIVRAKSMINALTGRGHSVHALLSGCNRKKILDLDAFSSFERRQGLTFVVEQGRIHYRKTAAQLDFIRFFKDVSSFDATGYDVVITDYEPITARIAHKHKIPSIGIGHLYAFAHRVPIAGRNPLARWIMTNYAPVRYPLGLHWHHFQQPILPPTIPDNVQEVERRKAGEEFLLVYLPFEKLEATLATLTGLDHLAFRLYANVTTSYRRKNVSVHPFDRQRFIEDLAACSGAICNAGFSFISEALHLGVKILTKPVSGQVEQESNALALHQLGLATVTSAVSGTAIEAWRETDPPEPMRFADVIPLVAHWIGQGNYDDCEPLIEAAWKNSPQALYDSRGPAAFTG